MLPMTGIVAIFTPAIIPYSGSSGIGLPFSGAMTNAGSLRAVPLAAACFPAACLAGPAFDKALPCNGLASVCFCGLAPDLAVCGALAVVRLWFLAWATFAAGLADGFFADGFLVLAARGFAFILPPDLGRPAGRRNGMKTLFSTSMRDRNWPLFRVAQRRCVLRLPESSTVVRAAHSVANMTSASTNPLVGWWNAPGSRPTIANPQRVHSLTARSFVLTTKLNCIAVKPRAFARSRE